jgi:hypothetical protein
MNINVIIAACDYSVLGYNTITSILNMMSEGSSGTLEPIYHIMWHQIPE